MRVLVVGDFKEAKELLEGYLSDPRVGYRPVTELQHYTVDLNVSDNGLRVVAAESDLAWHVLPRVAELTGGAVALDLGGNEKTIRLWVPPDVVGPVVLGVLRGLMRLGKHGSPGAQGVSEYAPTKRGLWARLFGHA